MKTQKRIVVWVQQLSGHANLYLQWHEAESGRRLSRSTGTADPREADQARGALEFALNNGTEVGFPVRHKRVRVWVQQISDHANLYLQWHDPVSGKRKSQSAKTSNRREAEAKGAALEAAINASLHQPVDRASETDLAELKEVVRQEAGVSMWVYFIRQMPAGPIKIGLAADPEKRLRSLQTSVHVPLAIIWAVRGTRILEAALHRTFHQSRIRGEWFRPSRDLFQFIRDIDPANTLS